MNYLLSSDLSLITQRQRRAEDVRVKAWTYLFCSGGLVTVEERKVRRGKKAVGGGS